MFNYNSSPELGEPTNEARAEIKFTLIMPCKEEVAEGNPP